MSVKHALVLTENSIRYHIFFALKKVRSLAVFYCIDCIEQVFKGKSQNNVYNQPVLQPLHRHRSIGHD